MKASKVTRIQLVQDVPLDNIPDGIYDGRWTGYVARAIIGVGCYEFRTEKYLRNVTSPCTIKVSRGEVTVEIKE